VGWDGVGGGEEGPAHLETNLSPHEENNLVFYSNIVKVTAVLVYPFISGEM
jgi:hypothetical protein